MGDLFCGGRAYSMFVGGGHKEGEHKDGRAQGRGHKDGGLQGYRSPRLKGTKMKGAGTEGHMEGDTKHC